MLKRFIIGLLISSVFFRMPLGIVAESAEGKLLVYEIKDEEIEATIMDVDVEEQAVEEKIVNLFEILTTLDYNENQIQLIPYKSAIDLCLYKDGHVDVVFNEELNNYGGSAHEFFMVNQLLYMVFELEDIKTVSFYIEDREVFTEGTLINNYTEEQFIERMKQSESY
ncbi:GerMN domain-containing protein [Vallitalea okinawensis]|uniref:GerMN domain-containing protein n=1 Tax=Vallitalea okinawensis TaxID=2078660 RepID=UPI000CFE0502|nr:GerMN domain-containing protein [Vallitalea okinawensis]